MITPRYYQQEAIDYVLSDKGSPILSSPTGSGKTLIALWIAKHYIDNGKSVVIMTPREEILKQFVEDAEEIIGPYQTGVVKSGWPMSPYRPLQICSWPTLRARAVAAVRRKRDLKMVMPVADICLVDEAHLSVSPQMGGLVLPYYQEGGRTPGLSATPATRSGMGLGAIYTSIKHVTTVRQLIKEGFLCPLEYFGGREVDWKGVDVRNGDYVAKQLGERVNDLCGDYVDNWLRLARDRHTIVFTPDMASCEGVAERYQESGITALALHSGKHPERRQKIVEAFKRRDAQVLVNVGIASYGFDCPSVNCIQLLRKTKSIVLHLQQLGRGMRIMEGKEECMVLDHTRNTRELGYADDLYRFQLKAGEFSAYNWSRDERSGEVKENESPEPHECEICHHLFSQRLDCPKCGHEIIPAKRELYTSDANLVRISRQMTPDQDRENRLPQGLELYQQLLHIQERRGYKPKWARMLYKGMHNQWPPGDWDNVEAEPPSHELLNYINRKNKNRRRRA